MKSYDLNSYPEMIRKGMITTKEAVDNICSFIINNYKVFNLQRYDEDFRSELVISFLENGIKFMNSYDPEIGDFFTFLYCYINSMVSTKLRALSQKSLKETVTMTESINTLYEKEYNYSRFSYHIGETPQIPFSNKKVEPDELKKIFAKTTTESVDKKILVLALKSAFYLTDDQIQKVCEIYNIAIDDFYLTIQYLKETIVSKSDKRSKAEERRNFAYYHHKKYNLQLEKILDSDEDSYYSTLSTNLTTKMNKHKNNWNKMNSRLEEGFLYLRPTTKSIAYILGICERQVTYYINCAKKEVEEKEKTKE